MEAPALGQVQRRLAAASTRRSSSASASRSTRMHSEARSQLARWSDSVALAVPADGRAGSADNTAARKSSRRQESRLCSDHTQLGVVNGGEAWSLVRLTLRYGGSLQRQQTRKPPCPRAAESTAREGSSRQESGLQCDDAQLVAVRIEGACGPRSGSWWEGSPLPHAAHAVWSHTHVQEETLAADTMLERRAARASTRGCKRSVLLKWSRRSVVSSVRTEDGAQARAQALTGSCRAGAGGSHTSICACWVLRTGRSASKELASKLGRGHRWTCRPL